MNEGKQCLQRDVTGSRCLEEGCGGDHAVGSHDTASLNSRLHQSSKRVSLHNIRVLTSFRLVVVFARVARTTHRGSWFHYSRMVAELLGCSALIHVSAS